MSLEALSEYTFISKYARHDRDKKRRETWDEAIDRVRDMHLRKYAYAGCKVESEINWAFQQVRQKIVLGSQRALQFGGIPIERKNARMYNCCVSYCDRIRFFQEAFWLLLCGSGVGFSVQKHHVAKLPNFHKSRINSKKDYQRGIAEFSIPDTIEGWCDALGVLLATYMPGNPMFSKYEECEVIFDYSLIRPKGASLASGVGKAPGPEPLKRALETIRSLMNATIKAGYSRFRPIDCYDLLMHASDAVLSGGVRRSATICLFSPDDEEMLTAKVGNWFVENPQRARSNNSALLLRGQTTKEQFVKMMQYVRELGEPGFVWSDSTELVVNPCVEIGMYPVDIETGESGWQMCNLCEINGRRIKSVEDFQKAARAAAIIGTCQAGYTNFEYLGPVSERIVRREALLGVSITGMMDNPDIIFDPEIQRQMAKLVVKTNEWLSKLIGINAAARCTCVKPAGTTSCLLGTGSGIHAHHSRRYIRHTQANMLEDPLIHFKRSNPFAVEKSVWNANGTDEIIAFCVTIPESAKTKDDINALALLNYVKITQENWVASGKVAERCVKPWLSHNVSNTINVRPEEWDGVTDFIFDHQESFAGVALLSSSGDKDYPQAPMVAVYTPEEIEAIYGKVEDVRPLILKALDLYDNSLWKACSDMIAQKSHNTSRTARGTDILYNSIASFARRNTHGSIENTLYMMKDIYNWDKWCTLVESYKPVDYTLMYEEQDNTTLMENIACAGGACSI